MGGSQYIEVVGESYGKVVWDDQLEPKLSR
jgi:hypothetical protein